MKNKSNVKRFLILSLAVAAFILVGGNLNHTKAQCNNDPFCKPNRAKPKPQTTTTTSTTSTNTTTVTTQKPKPVISVVLPPSIEQRIEYYKRIREEAALRGEEIPKVTTVLTLDEMTVTGIFRTPRGFAAMVEAKPIKLSYTIYPGEKFFDGQLVAIEENRLVFRKITKMSNNKFVTSVENKTLRQYTDQEVVQGTAPVQAQTQQQQTVQPNQTEVVTNNAATTTTNPVQTSGNTSQSDIIISPVDEMNRQQPTEQDNPTNKPVKKKFAKKNK